MATVAVLCNPATLFWSFWSLLIFCHLCWGAPDPEKTCSVLTETPPEKESTPLYHLNYPILIYIGYKIKDHRFSTPYTDSQAIHTIINDDHHCHLHDQRNHHHHLPDDQNSPFQSLSGRQPPQDQQQALHLFCRICVTHLSPMQDI